MRRHFPALLHVFVLPLVAVGLVGTTSVLERVHLPHPARPAAMAMSGDFLSHTLSTLPSWPTTTTAPPAPPRPKQKPSRDAKPRVVATPGPLPTNVAGQVNGYPCGGDLPPCWVLRRESHGNPKAVNATGCRQYDPRTRTTRVGCFGLWQFSIPTWAGAFGVERASDATPAQQNERARQLWAGGRGCTHWSACG